jgi:hypothetical protein
MGAKASFRKLSTLLGQLGFALWIISDLPRHLDMSPLEV